MQEWLAGGSQVAFFFVIFTFIHASKLIKSKVKDFRLHLTKH